MYNAIEVIKDGTVYDHRNKFVELIIGSPMIWVFTNEMPELLTYTPDRWKLWTINDQKELVALTVPTITPADVRPVTIGRDAKLANITGLKIPGILSQSDIEKFFNPLGSF